MMATGQYTRLYHELKDDYPGVWGSDAQLAAFVRLLMIADKWWPQWAPKPFGRPTYAYQSLIECGLVVISPDGNGFSVKGLHKERAGRSEHGKRAASSRWSNAPSNAQPMPSKAEQSKAEQSNGQSPEQMTDDDRARLLQENLRLMNDPKIPGAVRRAAEHTVALLREGRKSA